MLRTLQSLKDGDFLVYTDAAMHFVGAVGRLVEALEGNGHDLLLLGEGFWERQYTKRDAFVLMAADVDAIVNTPQRFASTFVIKKSPWSMDFFKRYLDFAEDPRVLTDQPNCLGLANYPGFVAHRHDQSILSILSKKEGICIPRNTFVREGLQACTTQILNHTRAHHAPRRIIDYLKEVGILDIADVLQLARLAKSSSRSSS
ncbi:MAG: hypothetical protein ACR2PG_10610 [Hyphomicrobiaceae bacterium]